MCQNDTRSLLDKTKGGNIAPCSKGRGDSGEWVKLVVECLSLEARYPCSDVFFLKGKGKPANFEFPNPRQWIEQDIRTDLTSNHFELRVCNQKT